MAVALGLAACSGKSTTKAIEDARHPQPRADGPDVRMPTGPYRVDTTAKTGDVQVRVEWKNVPMALRASPGNAPCGEPAMPALAPTTTWGIPEVVVAIETDHGKAPPQDAARIEIDTCASTPRLAIAGPMLSIASTAEQPVEIALRETGKLPLGTALTDGPPRAIYLPIAGHEVTAALTPGSIYSLGAEHAPSTTIVSATSPYIAITEASGQVIVRDIPVGSYPVHAWLPARAGAPSKVATGAVTVTDGALAEVTLDIGAP